MSRMILKSLFFIALLGISIAISLAQDVLPLATSAAAVATPTPGIPIPLPTPTGVLGHLDPAALIEVTAHRTAVGLLPWTGMQAAGQITYASDTTSYPVSLSNFGDRAFRIDVTTSKGVSSTRIYGVVGKQQESDGSTVSLAIDNCQAGLFPFELARSVYLQSPSVTLTDRGVSAINGANLHRVTLERATLGRNATTKQRQTVVIDLYFDPSTHLLVKSRVPVDVGRNVKLISDVTYGDYRMVGTAKVPFQFSETIDGQPYRSLQLSAVTLVSALSATLFAF